MQAKTAKTRAAKIAKTIRDRELASARMTSADVVGIAERAASTASRWHHRRGHPRMSETEWQELCAVCAADVVARGRRADDSLAERIAPPADLGTFPHSAAELRAVWADLPAVARDLAARRIAAQRTAAHAETAPTAGLPLWCAVDPVWRALPTDDRRLSLAVDPMRRDFLRDRWAALTLNAARRWTDARAADLAERIAPGKDPAIVQAGFTAQVTTEAASAAADGVDLIAAVAESKPERIAVLCSLMPPGRTAVDLAPVLRPPMAVGACRQSAMKGRESITRRYVGTEGAAGEWTPADLDSLKATAELSPAERAAIRAARDELRRAARGRIAARVSELPTVQEERALRASLMTIPAIMQEGDIYRGASIEWPLLRDVEPAPVELRRNKRAARERIAAARAARTVAAPPAPAPLPPAAPSVPARAADVPDREPRYVRTAAARATRRRGWLAERRIAAQRAARAAQGAPAADGAPVARYGANGRLQADRPAAGSRISRPRTTTLACTCIACRLRAERAAAN